MNFEINSAEMSFNHNVTLYPVVVTHKGRKHSKPQTAQLSPVFSFFFLLGSVWRS